MSAVSRITNQSKNKDCTCVTARQIKGANSQIKGRRTKQRFQLTLKRSRGIKESCKPANHQKDNTYDLNPKIPQRNTIWYFGEHELPFIGNSMPLTTSTRCCRRITVRGLATRTLLNNSLGLNVDVRGGGEK